MEFIWEGSELNENIYTKHLTQSFMNESPNLPSPLYRHKNQLIHMYLLFTLHLQTQIQSLTFPSRKLIYHNFSLFDLQISATKDKTLPIVLLTLLQLFTLYIAKLPLEQWDTSCEVLSLHSSLGCEPTRVVILSDPFTLKP